MLQEISRTSLPSPKNDEAALSWHSSTLAVRTEKYVVFYEFSRNLGHTGKKIDFIASEVPIITDSPLDGLIPEKFTSPNVKNIDFTQMIFDPSLWPHSPLLVQEMATIADVQWSTALTVKNQCVLAVLNNIGNVNFIAKSRHTWKSILDLSELIKKIYLSLKNWNSIQTMKELKIFADTLESNAMIWGPKAENGCYFVTAQKNGNILFWLLESVQDEIKPQFLGEIYESFIGEIISLIWIQKSEKELLLICSNVLGQIYSFNCFINNNEIKVSKFTCLWSHKDRMISKCIKYLVSDDKIALFFNKHRHLLVQIVDRESNVLLQHFENINDHRITDIGVNKNGVYVTTVNFKIYKVNLIMLNNDLQFDLKPVAIENNDPYSTCDLQSITFSTNSLLWAVAAKDRKIVHRQRTHKSVDVIFFADNEISETVLLLENPSRKFTDYWDCIELLRCNCMKLKALPSIDFNILYLEANEDIYKLKLYLILLQLHLNLENLLKNKSRTGMPENSVEVVKEKILVLRACQVLNTLFEGYRNAGSMLEEFELKSYIGAKRYLRYYCQKYDKKILEFVRPEVMNIIKVEDALVCQGCDEGLNGYSCKNGHLNMFCSLTFIPIEGLDYLSCQVCGCTYRSELYVHNPKCVFCDT